jgi:hypothetical protein
MVESFQFETIPLISKHFKFVDDVSDPTYNKIHHHVAPLIYEPEWHGVGKEYQLFIRDLILNNNQHLINTEDPHRLIYISRNKCANVGYNNGCMRRVLYDEATMFQQLQSEESRFECIYLEDYPVIEKIKIFQTAKLIVTPNGSAGCMCLFANPKTTYIEIHDGISDESYNQNQIETICKAVNLRFIRYTDVHSVDEHHHRLDTIDNGVMNTFLVLNNINHFTNFVKMNITC